MMRRSLLALLALLLVTAACGDDDGAGTTSASASASGVGVSEDCEIVDGVEGDAGSEVHVTLDEYSVDIEEDGADAGIVKIEATNAGDQAHEVVILEGPMSAVESGEGGVDESGLVGEIEAFDSGKECQGSFELAAGTYTLLCAIVEESGRSHYDEGMVAELEVK